MLTQARLKELLSYDPETGVFTRVKKSGPRCCPVGNEVGRVRKDGYLGVAIDGREYMLHRLVWVFTYGHFPYAEIDHIDGVRSNNIRSNLRAAEKFENHQNKGIQGNNTSGRIGVTWRENRRHWMAQIQVHGRRYYLGGFKTLESAEAAYAAAKARLHQFQPTSRK